MLNNDVYIADFETVVEKNPNEQTSTEVWAWAITKMFDDSRAVEIGNNINSFFDYLKNLYHDKKRRSIIVGFHNLKFDGQFIGCYLKENGYKFIFNGDGEKIKTKELNIGEYTTFINDMGAWYSLTVRLSYYLAVEFRDTLKILPLKVGAMHKAFGTEHDKLSIEYDAHEHANEEITAEEKAYIGNDVLVVAEALEIFIKYNDLKSFPTTIGSVALKRYKRYFTKKTKDGKDYFNEKLWNALFPDLTKIQLDAEQWGAANVDEYIRNGFRGGWCHTERPQGIQGKSNLNPDYVIKCYDVNSLYPSVMQDLKNLYPVGLPMFCRSFEEFTKIRKDQYYYIRFKTKFTLKSKGLPFVQIKNSLHCLKNANLRDSKSNITHKLEQVELTMPQTMFNLFCGYYDLIDFEFLDCIYFNTATPKRLHFTDYVHDLGKEKQIATIEGNKGKRSTVKLLLNNLYGKFSVNPNNSMSIPEIANTEEYFKTEVIVLPDKEPLYIPVGAAITAYARCFTVSCCIANKKYFVYSDTDSMKLACPSNYEPKQCPVDDVDWSCWKFEGQYTNMLAPRQKTYVLYNQGSTNIHDYEVTACGLQDKGKELFLCSVLGCKPNFDITKEQEEFINTRRTVSDFNTGLVIPYKLTPKKIRGGVVLVNSTFSII